MSKDTKPTLAQILEFSKRNPDQLVKIIPEKIIAHQMIENWTKSQNQARFKLATRQKTHDEREKSLAIGSLRNEVDYMKLTLEYRELNEKFSSQQQLDNERRKGVLEDLKAIFIAPDDKVITGNQQLIQTHLKAQFAEVEKKWFPKVETKNLKVSK